MSFFPDTCLVLYSGCESGRSVSSDLSSCRYWQSDKRSCLEPLLSFLKVCIFESWWKQNTSGGRNNWCVKRYISFHTTRLLLFFSFFPRCVETKKKSHWLVAEWNLMHVFLTASSVQLHRLLCFEPYYSVSHSNATFDFKPLDQTEAKLKTVCLDNIHTTCRFYLQAFIHLFLHSNLL